VSAPARKKPNPGSHTPPLGHKALTPLYDFAIAASTREGAWRRAFVREIAIHDIGSGTGSLAALLLMSSRDIDYVGVDPDADAIKRAQKKVARLPDDARFECGYFSADGGYFEQPPDKIVTSLVLHQVPLAEKKRILEDAFAMLRPGGAIFIADYGEQKGIMRLLFRATVQALDGVEDTQPNADGIITNILNESGFLNISECARIPTPTGVISIYRAAKG